MRNTLLALALLTSCGSALAVHTVSLNGGNPISVPAGGSVSVPFTYSRAAGDPVGNVGSLDATANTLGGGRLTFGLVTLAPQTSPAGAVVSCPVQNATSVFCGFFNATAPGVAVGDYVIAGSVVINASAGAAANENITFSGVSCSDQMGNKIAGACVGPNKAVSITGGGPIAPTATLATPVTLTGGVGSAAVSVATAGTAGGSLGLNCTIPATGASAFAITSGGTRNITGPATVGANAPAIGLSCVPGAVAVQATLSCAQTPTPVPGAALPALTSQVTCPIGGVIPPTITPNLLGGTAAAPVTLNIANTAVPPQPVGTVINITGLAVTGAGFVAPAVGSWGACTYSADVAPPAGSTSNPGAFTAGPQLVFNSTNNATAQPQVIGATRQVGSVSAILTCPVLPVGTGPAATANVYRLVLAPGAPVAAGVVVPVTAPGNVTLPSYSPPTGSSSTALNFNITGANGAVACVATGAGYTATPNPLNLVVGTAGGVTVTYTGAAAGTFAGTLTCNAVAPATGGPFVYNLSTTVSVPTLITPITVTGSTISLPEYVVGAGNNGSSSTVLNFGITGGAGALNCIASGAGFAVTPSLLNLTVAGPNVATVTYTGSAPGTFLGTVVCTPVAPATGGPFTYNFRASVAGATVQVPTLGNISLMLLIAGFLGLGMVLVGRRQA